MHAGRMASTLLLIACVGVLGVALVYPIAMVLRGGFVEDPGTGSGFSLDHLAMVARDPVLRGGLANSALIATCTTLAACAIGVPMALVSSRHSFPFKAVFSAGVLVPLILPPFVGAIGMKAILGRTGVVNTLLGLEWDLLGDARFAGVVAVQALSLYPIIYLNALAALANLDPAMDEAATGLGAGPWRRLSRITLPLARPGIFAGVTIVFIWSFTELGAPLMFDFYRVTPVQIFFGLKELSNSAQPYALTVVMLASSIAFYAIGKFALGRAPGASSTRAARAASESPLTGAKGWIATAAFALVTFTALLPHLGVALTSVSEVGAWYRSILPTSVTASHFEQALAAPDSSSAIATSLKLSLMAVGVSLVLGLSIAYILTRTRAMGKGLLDALTMLPLAVPGLVMAFGYIAISRVWPMGKDGPLGDMILGATPNPVPLLVCAYAVRRLPYIVRSCVAGLQQTSGELEEAALNLGASRLATIAKIVIPLIAANLIAGALLVFSFSMLEVSDSMLLAQQPRHYPITRAIFAFSERLGDGPYIASALGVWGMLLLALTLIGASTILGKKLGAVFKA